MEISRKQVLDKLSCEKVMFSEVFVCPWGGRRGGSVLRGCHP